ncbi:restriction endonuclease subunit S [Planococcus kocurii]|uniref:restriction endonuclease subunit S n=1 Tax=Planococcus kocurii TaxID=1374 RepID=UPI003D037115
MMTNVASMSDNKLRFDSFSEPFKEYKLGDITETISRPIKMSDEKEYLLVTVKRRNEGIVERGIYKGKEIKVKSQFEVATGDFLISKRQIIHGACEIVPINMSGAIVSNEYHILHGKQDLLLTEYLNLLSKTPKLKNFFALSCVGVDIEKMLFRIEDWKKRVVKIPSIEEQKKVVSFFDIFNRKLEKQRDKIEQLEQFKKGMMQKIFSQELRFKDFDGGEFGEWEESTFGEIITTFSGGTPLSSNPKYYNGEIPFIRSGEIYSDKTELFITDEGLQNSSAKIVNEGDLLLALYGATSGEIAVSKINGAINQAILCIRSKQHIPFIMYYWEYKKENILKTYLQGGQGNISASIVKSIDISLPIIEEQIKIGSFFADIATKVEKEKKKLMVLEEQKKGFMQGIFV